MFFNPKSLLAFIIGVSVLAYYAAITSGNQELKAASSSLLWVFVPFFLAFLALALFRNIRSL